MPDIDVSGQPAGGGIAGIPTKWLLIGGGAAALAFVMLRNTGAPAAGGNNDVATGQGVYGQALGPNAALALADTQHQILTQSGLIQDQLQHYFDAQAQQLSDWGTGITGAVSGVASQVTDVSSSITGLSGHLDTQAQNLTSLLTQWGELNAAIGQQNQELLRGGTDDPTKHPEWAQWFASLYGPGAPHEIPLPAAA